MINFYDEKLGGKDYARNITHPGGNPIYPLIIISNMNENIISNMNVVCKDQDPTDEELTEYEMETILTKLENNEYIDEYEWHADINVINNSDNINSDIIFDSNTSNKTNTRNCNIRNERLF